MATEPQKAKRKQQGPRKVAEKVIYLTYKGQIEGDPSVMFDPKAALDLVLADRDLKMVKVTIPRNTRKKATDAPAGEVAQAA